ncbi:hypothetical protein FBY04_11379 [Pseudomonas sp. SJZ080]|nr:hypothetical protein FBY04_11379 [Pseudomonas sp. SJZ080]
MISHPGHRFQRSSVNQCMNLVLGNQLPYRMNTQQPIGSGNKNIH